MKAVIIPIWVMLKKLTIGVSVVIASLFMGLGIISVLPIIPGLLVARVLVWISSTDEDSAPAAVLYLVWALSSLIVGWVLILSYWKEIELWLQGWL